MKHTGKKFAIGFAISAALLFFVTTVYLDIPFQPMMAYIFLFVSVLIGLLFGFSHRHGLHAGHSLIVLGFVIIIVLGFIVAGSITTTFQGEVREKTWDIDQEYVTYMVVGLGFGFLFLIIGMYVSWRKWVGR